MSNEIIFPTDTPIVDKLGDNDKLMIATPDGTLSSLSGRTINKVTPIASIDEIAAIRIQKLDGSQRSATVDQVQSLMTGKLDITNDAASDTSTLAGIYAQDSSGAPLMATPAQMREMVGIDYSLLTEQIVPGEFWRAPDGTRKQVYAKTYAHNIPASIEGMQIWPGITGVEPYRIYSIDETLGAAQIDIICADFRSDDSYDGINYTILLGSNGQLLGRLKTTSTLMFGGTTTFTIKYIKR